MRDLGRETGIRLREASRKNSDILWNKQRDITAGKLSVRSYVSKRRVIRKITQHVIHKTRDDAS